MAVAGILGQELLGVTPAWWEAGAKEYDIPAVPLTAIEFTIMGFLETKRYQGFKQTGTVSCATVGNEGACKLDPAASNCSRGVRDTSDADSLLAGGISAADSSPARQI